MSQLHRKALRFIPALLLALCALLAACGQEAPAVADGTYRAEFDAADANGYIDFVEITFSDGLVVSVAADAYHAETGGLKSASESYREDMQPQCGTFPEKYYRDLINQYLANPTADSVDTVAGATCSSQDFVRLARALEQAVQQGNAGTVVVPRE